MNQMSDIMHDPEVSKVQLLCENPERYAVHYEDGSATLVDREGKLIRSPLGNYDVISRVEYIGRLEGKPHFAFEGRDYANRHMSETGMFDSEGHQKLFRDPRSAGIDGVDYIKWEFQSLERLANDPRNPRRDDPMLVDIDSPHQFIRPKL